MQCVSVWVMFALVGVNRDVLELVFVFACLSFVVLVLRSTQPFPLCGTRSQHILYKSDGAEKGRERERERMCLRVCF